MKIKISDRNAYLLRRAATGIDASITGLANELLAYVLESNCAVCNKLLRPEIYACQAGASHPVVCSIRCLAKIDTELLAYKLEPESSEEFHTPDGDVGYWYTGDEGQWRARLCHHCSDRVIRPRLQIERAGYGKGAVIVKSGNKTRYYCLKCCFPADTERTSTFYTSLPALYGAPLPHLVDAP